MSETLIVGGWYSKISQRLPSLQKGQCHDVYSLYKINPSQGHCSSLADVCTHHSPISSKHPTLNFRSQLNTPLARNILLHVISHIFQRRLVGALYGRLQVTCVGYQSKNVGKYFQHTGGIQIRSEILIVCFVFYGILLGTQHLLETARSLARNYMNILQPSLITWQFLTNCQYPVMSHKISVTHN